MKLGQESIGKLSTLEINTAYGFMTKNLALRLTIKKTVGVCARKLETLVVRQADFDRHVKEKMMNILLKSNLRIRVFSSLLVIIPVIKGLLVLLVFFLFLRRTVFGNHSPRSASGKPAMRVWHQEGKSFAFQAVFLVFLGTMSAMAHSEFTVKRVSENATGEPGNGSSNNSRISANGRFVVFSSFATNLILDDTNSELHVFVKNVGTGEIVRVSEDAFGIPGDDLSGGEGAINSISEDGRIVAFESYATNLVPGDTNNVSDIFLKNVETGEIVRASENAAGEQGNSESHSPSLSADGDFVAFESDASNLVPGDTNRSDVFVKNVGTGEIVRVSENAEGMQGNGNSGAFNFDTGNLGTNISISADGRLVAFPSSATNLVPNDMNDKLDVFVKNVRTGEIVRASEDAAGIEGNGRSGDSGISLSADGQVVAFSSFATNLVLNDTNETDDVFVKNLETGEIVQVSENPAGELMSTGSNSPSLSSDGSIVVFQSSATSLVPGGTDRVDIFVKNVRTSEIVRVGEGGRIPSTSADGRFVAFSSFATNLVPDDTNDVSDIFLADVAGIHTLTTPGNLRFAVYSRTAAEVFWDRSPDNRAILYEVIRNGELIGVLDALSVFEDELQPDVGYTYLITAIDNDGNRSATATVSFTTRDTVPSVSGMTISWPDDGWYQVQRASDYFSVCEGGRSCDVASGSYNVINHTTGRRFEGIEVQPVDSGVVVTGNTISWPDVGWYQVQNSADYTSLCEGGLSCVVPDGTYIVINHTTGKRFEGIVVPSDNDGVMVNGNTISWPDDGWYQVQNAVDYTSLCEGGLSCEVPDGTYIVINHTTGQRFEGIVVPSDNDGVMVNGNTISWPDDGWYQVQSAVDYTSYCEGGRSCDVADGVYNVINHTTGERFEDIVVGE